MNKIQMGILAIILTIIVVSIWNMPNNVQNQNLNETNNSISQSNVLPLERPPFLVEVP